ncbi:MAG: AbrB family transcriptional regulator, partial [Rhodospirillaceae bacterium]|nr:AbrB family transcriptional regulator [Rhodospirillaceae bacterium]
NASVLPEGGPFTWTDAAWLLGCASIGYAVSRVFKMPSAAMTGAMVTASALYLSGTVNYRPPDALLWVALWILGSAIGSRFSTVTAATFFRISKHSLAAAGLIFACSAVFALFASWITGTRYLTALLSFTPGGVAEMCLIAISFDIDPAFVAMHHLTRIAILIICVPLAVKLLFPNKS